MPSSEGAPSVFGIGVAGVERGTLPRRDGKGSRFEEEQSDQWVRCNSAVNQAVYFCRLGQTISRLTLVWST